MVSKRMSTAVALAAFVALGSPAAFAGGRPPAGRLEGPGMTDAAQRYAAQEPGAMFRSRFFHSAGANQVGAHQRAVPLEGSLFQSPPVNTAQIQQSGHNLAALVQQRGSGNLAIIRQIGSGDRARITQTGSDNVAEVIQIGKGLDANVVQPGSGGRAFVVQGGIRAGQVWWAN